MLAAVFFCYRSQQNVCYLRQQTGEQRAVKTHQSPTQPGEGIRNKLSLKIMSEEESDNHSSDWRLFSENYNLKQFLHPSKALVRLRQAATSTRNNRKFWFYLPNISERMSRASSWTDTSSCFPMAPISWEVIFLHTPTVSVKPTQHTHTHKTHMMSGKKQNPSKGAFPLNFDLRQPQAAFTIC